MKQEQFCQSCSMPLTEPDFFGTESDGSASPAYCKFCYQDGHFTNPGISLAEMQALIVAKMTANQIPASLIKAAVARTPFLKRWKRKDPLKKEQVSRLLDPSLTEKHPLEELPEPGNMPVTAEELDRLPDEDTPGDITYESPEPGEGP